MSFYKEEYPESQLLADFHFDNDKMPLQWDEVATDATVDVNPAPAGTWVNDGYVSMTAPDDGDIVVRQSKEYYRAKGSKLIRAQFTTVLNVNTTASTAAEGCTSRVGMFDRHADKTVVAGDVGNSGFFFEYRVTDGTTLPSTIPTHPLYVGVRYGADDAGTDTLIRQDAFNVNDLNRSSHISIDDWSKLYTFEILYNAIGYVEWAVYLDGERIVLHREQDISSVLNILPRFNMPIRFEIENTDTGVALLTHEMRQFNATVADGLGTTVSSVQLPPSSLYNIKHLTQITQLLYTIDSTDYVPVFSFRLKDAFIRDPIRMYEIMYLITKRAPFAYAIVRNATLTTPSWVDSGNKLEYDVTTATATDLTDIVYETFVDSSNDGGMQYHPSTIAIGPAPLVSDIAGNTDTFTVIVRKQSQFKITGYFGLRWVE